MHLSSFLLNIQWHDIYLFIIETIKQLKYQKNEIT